jgi:UDP-GlcNAc:undecaprenyl-phosphate/decaprenyl-phosphate GlcNAc-1-phosphate transferase
MMPSVLLTIFCSTLFVCFLLHNLIIISHKKNLFDTPSELRKIHIVQTPNLGGIAIFLAVIMSLLLIPNTATNHPYHSLFICTIIIVLLGLKDDLIGVDPKPKMLVQIAAAMLIVLLGKFQIAGFQGLFGINQIPGFIGFLLSVLVIVLITNAINLIDGINCLAAGLSILITLVFTYLFWQFNDLPFFYLSLSLSSALAGFLYYNKTPAKIFMGDTGSLTLGFTLAILLIHLLNLVVSNPLITAELQFSSAPAIMLALLIIPVFDIIRIFIIRWLNGSSPMTADRNHIHHRLIDLGLTHHRATVVLLSANALIFAVAVLLRNIQAELLMALVLLLATTLNSVVTWRLKLIKNKKTKELQIPFSKPELAAI